MAYGRKMGSKSSYGRKYRMGDKDNSPGMDYDHGQGRSEGSHGSKRSGQFYGPHGEVLGGMTDGVVSLPSGFNPATLQGGHESMPKGTMEGGHEPNFQGTMDQMAFSSDQKDTNRKGRR